MTASPSSTATFDGTAHLPPCPLPVVHLNGTGRITLLHEYQTARQALLNLSDALAQTTCNARDYYTRPEPNAYYQARDTRQAVFALLDELDDYLVAHIQQIAR
jgi:hypothetical protein